MNKYTANVLLAVLIAIIPILGFPPAWKAFFTFALGLIVAIISYTIYREELARHPKPKMPPKSTTYVDNLNEKTDPKENNI